MPKELITEDLEITKVDIKPHRVIPNFIRSKLTGKDCSEASVHLDTKIIDMLYSAELK